MADQDRIKGAAAPAKDTSRKTAPIGGSFLTSAVIAASFGAAGIVSALALADLTGATPVGKDGSVRLLPVEMTDLDAALETVAPEQRDQIRKDVADCKTALFMMDIGPMPGAKDLASGFVQLRVGNYLSPRFAVGENVTSFAVPHPIPETRIPVQGDISVIGTARSLRVSFSPPVDYPVLSGSVSQPVYYELPQTCGIDQGKRAG